MFLESSRYHQVPTVETTDASGRRVSALKLRRLPEPSGSQTEVRSHDRLDIMAQDSFGDSTMFWHIADANSQLDPTHLASETGSVIVVPNNG